MKFTSISSSAIPILILICWEISGKVSSNFCIYMLIIMVSDENSTKLWSSLVTIVTLCLKNNWFELKLHTVFFVLCLLNCCCVFVCLLLLCLVYYVLFCFVVLFWFGLVFCCCLLLLLLLSNVSGLFFYQTWSVWTVLLQSAWLGPLVKVTR